jgi:integrase
LYVNKLVAAKTNPSTIRNAINPIRAIYRDAIADGTVTINPCLGLRLPSVDAVRDRVADPAEATTLVDALAEDDRALWATAFYAGLRRGELRALRCRNVDIKQGMIAVEAGWDDVDGPIDPKSRKGRRTTPIPAMLSKLLAAHMLKTGRSGDDFIFGTTKTRPFTPSHMRRRALKAWADENVKRAKRKLPPLEPIAFHSCRHTYVSLMYAAGVPLETIGDYVGHSSTYMTDKYRHLLPGSHDDARKKLDALLSAAKL